MPLHYYFIKAMDALYANLTVNVPLPPAQVVRTIAARRHAGRAPPITAANVPPIAARARRRQPDHVLGQHGDDPRLIRARADAGLASGTMRRPPLHGGRFLYGTDRTHDSE